jgi:hypothetical protein
MIGAVRKTTRDGVGMGRDGGCDQCREDLWTESAARPIIELKLVGRRVRLCETHADRVVVALLEATHPPSSNTIGDTLRMVMKALS